MPVYLCVVFVFVFFYFWNISHSTVPQACMGKHWACCMNICVCFYCEDVTATGRMGFCRREEVVVKSICHSYNQTDRGERSQTETISYHFWETQRGNDDDCNSWAQTHTNGWILATLAVHRDLGKHNTSTCSSTENHSRSDKWSS